MFGQVVVGVDFGPGGDAAVALARRLVRPGGRLTLTHVVASDPTVLRGQRDAEVELERSRSLSLLDRERSLARLDAGDDSVSDIAVCAVCAASVRRGLCAVAERRRADLVVVGAARGGRLGRVLLGDATLGVLRGAPCSVAVAPAGFAVRPGDGLGDPAAVSPPPDLLVVASQPPGRWRRSPPERLARLARRPLLVLAVDGSPRGLVADGSPRGLVADGSPRGLVADGSLRGVGSRPRAPARRARWWSDTRPRRRR